LDASARSEDQAGGGSAASTSTAAATGDARKDDAADGPSAAAAAPTAPPDQNDDDDNDDARVPPACFVVVYNLAKRHNVGNLLRCCTAFGVKAACLVGSRDFNTFGAHGAAEHVPLRHYATLDECVADLRARDGARVVGVEIDPSATPVHTHAAFQGPTAFMLGNEGQGLSAKQLRLCDGGLVYIAQHGPGTASLNVTVAASIVLHQFSVWARYPERARRDQKFVVAPRPQRTAPRGVVPGARPARPDAAECARVKGEGEAWVEEQMNAAGLEGALALAL